VGDYGGFTMNSGNGGIKDITGAVFAALNPYSASVTVVQEAFGGITDSTASLRVTVTVTGPGNTTVTLDGYRTRYAPNAI
jgi:MSHA pilin protein MshD